MMKYTFEKPTLFSKGLTSKGKALLKSKKSGRYANSTQWLLMICALTILVLNYFSIIFSYAQYWSMFGAVIVGFFCYMVVAAIGHDAAHNSISKRPVINRIAVFFSFALIGVSGSLWAKRHIRIHHQIPNVVGNQIDGDGSTILRLHDKQEWKPWHRFQSIYAPLLYLIVLLYTAWVEDFTFLKRELKQSNKKTSTILEFLATKVFHLALAIGLPLIAFNSRPIMVLICYLIATMSASFLFVIFNIGTHINIHSETITPGTHNNIKHDWAEHQIKTTINWSPENKIAGLLTGGVNAHVTHHLFPYAAHCHNTDLAKLVTEASKVHNIKLKVVTFKEMVLGHFSLINKLSKPVA